MAEQVRFGGLRNMFHVIDFAVAQSFEHELAVVFEGDPIHRLSSSPVADRSRRRGRQTQRLFQPIHRRQNLSMKFRQGHPALAEMAIVWGVVSILDKFPGICYNRLWTYCLLGGGDMGRMVIEVPE